MSCYYPMYGMFTGYNGESGKPMYKVLSSQRYVEHDPRDIQVPCGRCIGCRLDHARQWANRCVLELDHHKGKAIFITLTYNDLHVPISHFDNNGVPVLTLYKKHLQDFLKRLRYYFSDKEVRFFAAGEYGSHTLRPHYHAIIFGLELSDFDDAFVAGTNKYKQSYYGSPKLDKIWKHGFTSLAPVSWQTCAYVARYNVKLYQTDDLLFDSIGVARPFIEMSRRPGIGAYYAIEHPDDLSKPYVYFEDTNGVRSVNEIRLPKFVFNKLELTNSELHDKLKTLRKRSAQDSFYNQLKHTDLDQFEYRLVQESKKTTQVSNLISCRKEL